MNSAIYIPILSCSLLYLSLACVAQDSIRVDECPMHIRPVIPVDKNAIFHNFDEERAQEIVIKSNGDLVVVRFNDSCGLSFDAALFHIEKLESPRQRREAAAGLVRLFRNDEVHNAFIMDRLQSIIQLESDEFRFSFEGTRLDEEHLFRMVNIEVSPDFHSAMFGYVLTYSWLPPSGE